MADGVLLDRASKRTKFDDRKRAGHAATALHARNPASSSAVDRAETVRQSARAINEASSVTVADRPRNDAVDPNSIGRDPDTACAAAEAGAVTDKQTIEKCARVIADPTVELGARASCAGAAPGKPLNASAADAALTLIASSARDLFRTVSAAKAYLAHDNFDNSGMTARMLVAKGRGTAVIARLDELRYGTQG